MRNYRYGPTNVHFLSCSGIPLTQVAVSVPFSGENATIAYELRFGVPSEDDGFMRYMMSEELVRGVLLQHLHEQGVSGCEAVGRDPASLWLYGKWGAAGGQRGGGVGRRAGRRAASWGLPSALLTFAPCGVQVSALHEQTRVAGKAQLNCKDEDG